MKGNKKGGRPMPPIKVDVRSSGFTLPDMPDRERAAQDRASDLHEDPIQSEKAKPGKAGDDVLAAARASRRSKFKAKSQLKALQS